VNKETAVARVLLGRCEAPLRAYFGDVKSAGDFLAWFAKGPLGERLSRGRTLREAMLACLREREGERPDAERAFTRAWEESAVEAVRERFRAGRRIVPFLAYQGVAAGEEPEDVGRRLGLSLGEVLAYVEEVERALREERVD